jgi:hypothetical protein
MNVLYRSICTTVCCVNEIMNGRIHLVACMLMNNANVLTTYVLLFRLDDYNMYHVCRVCQYQKVNQKCRSRKDSQYNGQEFQDTKDVIRSRHSRKNRHTMVKGLPMSMW